MLNYTQQTLHDSLQETPPETDGPALRALAAELPPVLDVHLKELVETALQRCPSDALDVKRLLNAFAAGQYTEEQFQLVVDCLDTREQGASPRARLCAWLLGVPLLRCQHRAPAAEVLRNVLRKRANALVMPAGRRMTRALGWTGLFAGGLAVLPWLTAIAAARPEAPWIYAGSACMMFLALYPVILVCLHQREVDSARELRFLAAHALGRLGEAAGLDALSAASLESDINLSDMALISLRVVLPELTPNHYGQLGPEASPNLCRLLKRCAALSDPFSKADFQFKLELLEAIEKVGDPRASGAVRHAARQWPPGPLTIAADRALSALEERKRRETERETLLRGTVQPVAADSELLRAAALRAESKPEQLLRPID